MREMTVSGQRVIFRSAEDMSAIHDAAAALVITSPPYWNLKDYGGPSGSIGHSSYRAYLDRLNIVWDECFARSRDDAALVINANTRRHQKTFYPIPLDIASSMRRWKLWDIVVWYIPNALPQPKAYLERLLDNKFEFVMIFTKGGDT